MRDVLAARSHRGFSGSTRRHGAGWARVLRGIGAAALRHRRPLATMLVLTGAGMAITLNALTFQAGRHPAPLFGQWPERGETRRPEAVGAAPGGAPLPPTRPAADLAAPSVRVASRGGGAAGASSGAAADGPATSGSLRPASLVAQPVRPVQPRDPIGDLIRTGSAGRDARPVSEPPRVAAAQRALSKLGYGPLKSDGLFGAETRQAVERFERDKHLPVTGELNARTLRELSAQAGAAME